jgi:hypothetical protein
MPTQSDIPLDSPLRTHPKRDLPDSFASTYPHGHISGHPRPPHAQRAFEARKGTILRTMNAVQIEDAYQEAVKKVRAILDEDRKRNEEIDREVDKMTQQRAMEKKIFLKLREERAKKDGKMEVQDVKEEGDT